MTRAEVKIKESRTSYQSEIKTFSEFKEEILTTVLKPKNKTKNVADKSTLTNVFKRGNVYFP